MHILVTGATGYIGHAVATALRRNGHHVLGLVRSDAGAQLVSRDEIEPVRGDLRDPGAFLARAREVDALVHCAADAEAHADLEAKMIEAVIAFARTRAARPLGVIYTTGVWLCGNGGARTIDEASTCEPLPLVRWRAPIERMLLGAASALLRPLVIRPGCVYGGAGGLTARWFASAAQDGAAEFVGPGDNHWSMIHVQDLAALYTLAAESSVRERVLFATDSRPARVRELATAASHAAGAGGHVRSANARIPAPLAEALTADQRIVSHEAERLLAWRPRFTGFVAEAERCFLSWRAAQPE